MRYIYLRKTFVAYFLTNQDILTSIQEVMTVEHSAEKQRISNNLILSYYNRYLRDCGIITEQDYLRLLHLINHKYPMPSPPR